MVWFAYPPRWYFHILNNITVTVTVTVTSIRVNEYAPMPLQLGACCGRLCPYIIKVSSHS
jgi:hypothetical protein